MKSRLIAALCCDLANVNVTALSRELEMSPKTFYKWKRRFEAEGLAGLEPRSRRPLSSPTATPVEVEVRVVELRKILTERGDDNGPETIRGVLIDEHVEVVPSISTIWRILRREGCIVAEPKKRPRSSYVRFEAAAPNECWQIDATHWALGDGTVVEIINIIDDHSRVLTRSHATRSCTTHTAWAAFVQAIALWGLPARCLSDNGLAFTGRLKGYEVFFETNLREAGVIKINARPRHPQTCGKVERFQQTLKKWLTKQPAPDTIDQLQTQLDQFAEHYNHTRRHQAIGRITPFQRWNATTRVQPHGPIPTPPRRSTHRVSANGNITVAPYEIGLGAAHRHQDATVIIDNGYATVIIGNQLIRYLELDPTRRYQPTGRPPGRPKTNPT